MTLIPSVWGGMCAVCSIASIINIVCMNLQHHISSDGQNGRA